MYLQAKEGMPRTVGKPQELEEARKDSSLEPSERGCGHLDLGPLVSRTVREQISVVLHAVHGALLRQPWEAHALRYVGLFADTFKPFL